MHENDRDYRTESLGHARLGLVQVAILNVINRDLDKAYGTAISAEVSRSVDREIADAQVYVALKRLEDQGLVTSKVEILPLPSKRTRGRPRKYYALTALGRRALESAGTYVLSNMPFMQSTHRGGNEGKEAPDSAWTSVVV